MKMACSAFEKEGLGHIEKFFSEDELIEELETGTERERSLMEMILPTGC